MARCSKIHRIQRLMQQHRRRANARALAQTAELSESENALIVAGVVRIDLDDDITRSKDAPPMQMGGPEKRGQQLTRGEIRIDGQARYFTDDAVRSSQARVLRCIKRIGQQTRWGIPPQGQRCNQLAE